MDGGWQRRKGWTVNRPFGGQPATDNLPATDISWHEATAYCRWKGGRLPTDAKWRLAACTKTRKTPTGSFQHGKTYIYPVGDAPTAGGSWWYGPEKTRTGARQFKPADFYAI